MDELQSRIWALPPDMIAEVMAQGTLDALVPDALKALAGQSVAKAPPDPIREGATVVITIGGILSPQGSYNGTSTRRLSDQIREFTKDSRIGATILHVQSPGGLVYGTREACDAIYEARQVKPIVAVADPMAASAAYWLASQASEFYASPSADVGSVGIYAGHTDQSGFQEKIGMKTTLISAGPKKVLGQPYEPLSEEAREEIQKSVDENYADFLETVARGRGVTAKDVAENYGQGGLLSAKRALAAGMIDGVMTLRDVIAKYSSSRNRLALMRRRAAVAVQAAAI